MSELPTPRLGYWGWSFKMAKELSQAAQVAQLVRQWLKAEGIPGRVTCKNYSMGDSVTVYLVDQVPAVYQKVKEYAAQYEYGSFDGMQDLYQYDNVNRDIPQTKYFFVNNDLSAELQQKIWEFARGWFDCLAAMPINVTEVYNIYVPQLGEYAGSVPRKMFGGGYNNAYFKNNVAN